MSRLPKPTGLPVPKSAIPRAGAAPGVRAGPPSRGPGGLPPPGGMLTGSRIASLPPPPGLVFPRAPASGATAREPTAPATMRPPAGAIPRGVPTAPAPARGPPAGARPPATRLAQSRTTAGAPPSGTKQVTSTTTVTVTKPTGQKTRGVVSDQSVVPKVSAGLSKGKIGAPVGVRRSQAAVPIPPPSVLRKQVAMQVKGTAAKSTVGSRVTAVGAKKTTVPPLEKIVTPAGPQQVLQKIITEKRVERSKHGEIVSRNIKTIETNPCTGETTQVEEEVQKLNPDFATVKGPIKEIVTIVSEKDITASYETRTENIIHETTKLDPGLGIDLQRVSQLVEEEKEDVENALRINPPELVNQSPEKFPLKKKLQTLRLSPENVALLEQSVIQPPISADEPLPEASPEVMAKVMNAIDKSMQPRLDPEATFNTLFTEGGASEPPSAMLSISSAAPGPLGDVVVPNESIPEITQSEMLSKQMEETSVIVQTAEEKPVDYSFAVRAPVTPKRKGRRKWEKYKQLTEEDPPWGKEDMPNVSIAVGAFPRENLDFSDLLETTQAGTVHEEMEKGIEYYLDCSPIQYCSRVQLRGSQPPVWFPGYIYALSDIGVSVAKSPSQVMFAAWRSVQPEIFSDDSIVYN